MEPRKFSELLCFDHLAVQIVAIKNSPIRSTFENH